MRNASTQFQIIMARATALIVVLGLATVILAACAPNTIELDPNILNPRLP
jgi:hypothetical protein